MKWGRGQCDPGAKLERTGIFTHLSKIPLQLAFTLSKKKFAVSFRYEDFPTGTKLEIAVMKTGKKQGKNNWKWIAEGRERGENSKHSEVVKF